MRVPEIVFILLF